MAVARSTPDRLHVKVDIQWRDAEQIPTLLSILSDIPPVPNNHDFEVMRRDDGRYTLITQIEHYVNSSTGPTLYDLVRRDGFPPVGIDYLEYGSDIIKQYQPDFDYTASEKHALLLLHTLERINRVRESIQDLQTFLWYSTPESHKKAVPPIKAPQRDVKAAVLQDVHGLSTLEIGETLGFKAPSDSHIKHENRAVAAAARRGRELLYYYFGVKEWRQKAERIRALRALWFKLNEDDQYKKQVYYLLAERKGTSLEVEEAAAMQDGFDQLLEEWIVARLRGDDQTAHWLMSKDPRFEQLARHL